MMGFLNRHSEKMLGYKVKTLYSTPSQYFKSVDSEIQKGILEIPTIKDPDFSHYDENIKELHSYFKGKDKIDYWTGYYSNRPSLKSMIYRSFNYYSTAQIFNNLALVYQEREIHAKHQ